eukprot:568782-Alexandrium_andersonii.AAC.1
MQRRGIFVPPPPKAGSPDGPVAAVATVALPLTCKRPPPRPPATPPPERLLKRKLVQTAVTGR